MAKAKSTRVSARRRSGNQRRERAIFGDVMKSARRKANEQENRRTSKRELKSVWAAVAADPHCDPLETGDWGKRFLVRSLDFRPRKFFSVKCLKALG